MTKDQTHFLGLLSYCQQLQARHTITNQQRKDLIQIEQEILEQLNTLQRSKPIMSKVKDCGDMGDIPENDGKDAPKAFMDNSDRFPLDVLLRKYHFRIHTRKSRKEPIWELWVGHEWVKFRQREALLRIPKREVQDAGYQQELHEKRWD